MSCSTTCLWLICAAIMDIDWVFGPADNLREKYILHFNTGIGLMLDCLVNSLVIFMSFKFSNKMYDAGCSWATNLCEKCCFELDMATHHDGKRMEQELALHQTKKPDEEGPKP